MTQPLMVPWSSSYESASTTTASPGSWIEGSERTKHYTCLHYAAAECHADVVLRMLATRQEVLRSINWQDRTGCTALHWAASVGSLEVAKLLLQCGADSDVRNYMGLTPVEWAEKRNRTMMSDLEEVKAEIRTREATSTAGV